MTYSEYLFWTQYVKLKVFDKLHSPKTIQISIPVTFKHEYLPEERVIRFRINYKVAGMQYVYWQLVPLREFQIKDRFYLERNIERWVRDLLFGFTQAVGLDSKPTSTGI